MKRIDLDDEEMPERILVELTHDEALYLAFLASEQSDNCMNAVMPGGGRFAEGIYEALTGSLFNRYYEDGMQGAAAAMRRRRDG
jgi:hypothetical protein